MRMPFALPVLLVFTLASCSQSSNLQDLEAFVAEIKNSETYRVEDLPPYAPDTVVLYTPHATDPFKPFDNHNAAASAPALEPEIPGDSHCINPKSFRNAQNLERYPLDSLRMVGVVSEKQRRFALIKDPQDLVHKVQSGDYLGQNNGRIVALGDAGVDVVEMIDARANGCYEERQARLVLHGAASQHAQTRLDLGRKPVF